MEFGSEFREIIWSDVHSARAMYDGHPPAHKLKLNAFDDRVTAVVEHNPTDADAVSDVSKWSSVAEMMILFHSVLEAFCFSDI